MTRTVKAESSLVWSIYMPVGMYGKIKWHRAGGQPGSLHHTALCDKAVWEPNIETPTFSRGCEYSATC